MILSPACQRALVCGLLSDPPDGIVIEPDPDSAEVLGPLSDEENGRQYWLSLNSCGQGWSSGITLRLS
jgi:hypothetical protein